MSKKVKQKAYTYKNKSIVFIPLVHFGQKEFYSTLKEVIEIRKKEGYRVFCEQVKKVLLHWKGIKKRLKQSE